MGRKGELEGSGWQREGLMPVAAEALQESSVTRSGWSATAMPVWPPWPTDQPTS